MGGRTTQPGAAACRLAAALGRDELCPETLCAYWESAEGGGQATGCGLDEVAPYLRTQPELARYLLELRARLEDVRGP